MLHEVLRPISTGLEQLQPGMIVDTSTWPARNVAGLIELRRLRIAMAPPAYPGASDTPLLSRSDLRRKEPNA